MWFGGTGGEVDSFSDQIAGENSAEAGQEKLVPKKATLWLLILHNTATTDFCPGISHSGKCTSSPQCGSISGEWALLFCE